MLKYLRDNNLTIDLETMNPVVMPKESVAKMEAMFPKPAANVRAQYDLGTTPKPSEFAQAIIVSAYSTRHDFRGSLVVSDPSSYREQCAF